MSSMSAPPHEEHSVSFFGPLATSFVQLLPLQRFPESRSTEKHCFHRIRMVRQRFWANPLHIWYHPARAPPYSPWRRSPFLLQGSRTTIRTVSAEHGRQAHIASRILQRSRYRRKHGGNVSLPDCGCHLPIRFRLSIRLSRSADILPCLA